MTRPPARRAWLEHSRRGQAFHGDGAAGVERELDILQRWQSARLARTYADLLASPRYRPAAAFFLDELYGSRIAPARTRLGAHRADDDAARPAGPSAVRERRWRWS